MRPRLLPVLLLVVAAACTRQPPATGCRSDDQCPSGSRCTSGVCKGDTRPTASIAPLATVEEYALARLDGSASTDPDGDLSEHLWTIRSVDAPCAPPEIAGREPVATVRFGCAGTYEVTLVARDALGVDSDPARVVVVARPSSGAPVVSAGADVATDHRCGGSPLRCTPTSVVRLAATTADGVTLRWSVQPPAERPLDVNRRVTFLPDAHAANPTVEIVTDGTAISGDWIFRAEAVDAYGVVGAAHTRVSIRNRPPVVTHGPAGPFEHRFDPESSAFVSTGAVAWRVVDPDGDPIEEISGVWRHVGDGDASLFDGDFLATTVWFEVVVPYAGPEDGLRLRGGSGLVRQIEISALDVNRTVGMGTVPIEIGNRPPVPAGGTFDTSVPHRFDGQRKVYVAEIRAGTFVDPDGDPIVDSTGPGLCDTIHARGNDVTVECAVPFQGVPALDQLVGVRTFMVAARDPWEAATLAPLRTVEIRNSPPTVVAGAPVPGTVFARVYLKLDSCVSDFVVDTTEFDVSVDVSDPDGDPVLVSANTSPGGAISVSPLVTQDPIAIPFHIYQPSFMWHCAKDYPPPISTVTGTDGAAPIRVGVSPTPVVH